MIIENTDQFKQELTQHLVNGVATVKFTKKDGSERTIRATLDPSLMTEVPANLAETIDVTKNSLAVYDVDAQGWRSFRWESVQSVDL
jgi:hypothetical protein